MKYRIDRDVQALLPPHTPEEAETLRRKLKREGCAPGSIVVANIRGDRILADGHHTLKACEELDIEPSKPRVIKLKNKEELLVWVVEQQGSRRNMTPEARAALAKKLADKGLTIKEIGEKLRTSRSTTIRDLGKDKVSPDTAPLPTPYEEEKPANGKPEGGTARPKSPDGPQVCDRCKRVNGGVSVRNCGLCADLNKGRRLKPHEKNGAVIDDWSPLQPAMGKLIRLVDALGRPYNASFKPEADALCRRVIEWAEDLRTWYERISGKKGPPITYAENFERMQQERR
jgi:hypothetical protein